MEPTASIAAKYDRPFHLTFVVKLTEFQLTTELHIKNPSSNSEPLEFQALFHNYIRAPSNEVLIFPLQHQSFYDKTAATEEEKNTPKKEVREGVDVRKFTDFVYEDVLANIPSRKYEIKWSGGGLEVTPHGFKDLVIWNPQEEAGSKLADMEQGGW